MREEVSRALEPWEIEHAYKKKVDAWARAWTEAISERVGGLSVARRCDVFVLLHEIRRASVDLDLPRKQKPQQLNLLEAAE